MFSRFFIDRPIFAAVVSILITLGGWVSFEGLPIEKFPDITPPVVRVSAIYPGASGQVIADSIAAPIEQEVNGVDGMIHMSSTSSNDGTYNLDITFEVGTNVDIATVLVQNRVSVAESKLPEEVRRQGLTTKKVSSSFVSVMTMYDKSKELGQTPRYSDIFLSNYLTLNVVEEMKRIKGVGDLRINPPKDYGMRIWLDPDKLRAKRLTTIDVANSLREQNIQVAAGQIGQQPLESYEPFQLQITTLGRLTDEKQFENIIIKSEKEGRQTQIKDIGRVELGARTYDSAAWMNGNPGASIIVYLAPGGNAVKVAQEAVATMDRLKKSFPVNVDYVEVFNVSRFIESSFAQVRKTLIEAVVLVVIVLLVFLQNWRTTLIPLITIPVSLIGTFLVISGLGFSLNTLTLFGLVLAIGIVVDDAIVVVENVERNMADNHLGAREATIQAMMETFGPIVAVSLVLMAVFLPTAAIAGIQGHLYKQFAVTIAVCTFFSAVNALTLSPALCALLLRGHHEEAPKQYMVLRPFIWIYDHSLGCLLNGFAWLFNRFFGGVTWVYLACVRLMTSWVGLPFALLAFVGLLGYTAYALKSVPTGFLPTEDQGFVVINLQLPDGASQERTKDILLQVERDIRTVDGVRLANAIAGLSLVAGTGPNNGTIFCNLNPWEERLPRGRSMEAILGDIRPKLMRLQDAIAFAFVLPPIDGLGNASGFNIRLLDKSALGATVLQQTADELVREGNGQAQLRNLNSSFRANVPQLFAEIDREKVLKLHIPLASVFQTLSGFLGSSYINDFNRFGRTFQVNIQAEASFRSQVESIPKLEVRNNFGKMVPLGSVLHMNEILAPDRVLRYNLYPSAGVIGEPGAGVSSGQAMDLVEQIVKSNMPNGMDFDWTAVSYQERKTGGQGYQAFILGIIVVFLILAAQYESWTLPLAVVLSVPMAVLGAFLALILRGSDNNVFTQIGLVLLIALQAKTAILIVEFARVLEKEGKSIRQAAIEAARLRFRPILMTALTFILGVTPLVWAEGAGANGRQALGTAVFGGMVGGTILGVLFVPVLYVTVMNATKLTRRIFGLKAE
jgi:hydrophobe/amphiphile efflux-1 (HAE1) family protein